MKKRTSAKNASAAKVAVFQAPNNAFTCGDFNITENIKLAPYTTFKIGGPARFFCVVKTEDELVRAVEFAKENKRRILVLGGGSNILIPDAGFSGLVIKNEIGLGENFIETQENHKTQDDTDNNVRFSIGAGVIWDDFVAWSVKQGFYGIENLSAIPGTVGAAPVQNIGAYGVEVSSCITKVRALDIKTLKFIELSNSECAFSYRDSFFKNRKGRYVITRVDFLLSRNGKVNIEYRELKDFFAKKSEQMRGAGSKGAESLITPMDVRKHVIKVRQMKLPDWKHWGTAGSFFKNPVISAKRYQYLQKKFPGIPGFLEPDGRYKVSLGWILDKVCDAKGMTVGNVGTFENQALVIVTKPGASATEVVRFAKSLMRKVEKETTIKIEGEVVWAV